MAENTRLALIRDLGAEVRQAREAAGLSQRQLARAADISSHSRVSELESGRRPLTNDEYERIFDALELGTGDRERLLGLARAAESPGELNVGPPGIGKTLAQLIDHERAAVRIVDVSPLLIPGLLQTSEYARAIIGDEPDNHLFVTLRAGRQEILRRRNPVELVALIDSEALLRPIAPRDVMADQLRYVLRIGELPNVTVQVVSSTTPGYHAMLAGPFELLQFAKAQPIVHLEHHRAAAFLWDEADVREFIEAAEKLRKEVAMNPDESAEFIAGIARGLETT